MAENTIQHTRLWQPAENESLQDDAPNFTMIYREHRLAVYRYILARVGHVNDAQDLTAQVFLNAYQHFASYRNDASVIYWLIGIARNQIIDFHRGQRPEADVELDQNVPGTAPPLEDVVARKAQLQRVSDALNALSEDRREALSLRLFAGLSNPEIAGIMDKSVDAIAMLIHRGIQDLKQRIGSEETL